jgi:hypothetical protein
VGEIDESDELDRQVSAVIGGSGAWTWVWKRTEIQMDGDFSPAQLRAIADVLDPPDAYDAPRTVSELAESVAGEQEIKTPEPKPRRKRIADLPEPTCKHCNDSGYLVNNMGEHRCFSCTTPMDMSRKPGRLPDEPVNPHIRVQPRPLTAAEITEPGWYWYGEQGDWEVVQCWEPGRFAQAGAVGFAHPDDLPGHFIGPLRAPE